MNEQLMERIITRILSEESYAGGRERFDMSTWVNVAHVLDDEEDPDDSTKINICNTACCIAGEAVLLNLLDEGASPVRALRMLEELDEEWEAPIMHRAVELLGLRPPDGYGTPRLFYREDWPEHYRYLVYEPGTDYNAEAVAAAVLMRDMIDGRVVLNEDDAYLQHWSQFNDRDGTP
jgi:hypothetical protein